MTLDKNPLYSNLSEQDFDLNSKAVQSLKFEYLKSEFATPQDFLASLSLPWTHKIKKATRGWQKAKDKKMALISQKSREILDAALFEAEQTYKMPIKMQVEKFLNLKGMVLLLAEKQLKEALKKRGKMRASDVTALYNIIKTELNEPTRISSKTVKSEHNETKKIFVSILSKEEKEALASGNIQEAKVIEEHQGH